jgi:hypothetical protein
MCLRVPAAGRTAAAELSAPLQSIAAASDLHHRAPTHGHVARRGAPFP